MINKTLFLNEITKIEKKQDGSFIVERNNMAYHIPNNDEYKLEYNIIEEYINENSLKINEYIEPINNITYEDLKKNIRIQRDMLLNEADILLMKYNEQVHLGIIDKNNEYYTALLQYKQNLRDITKQIDFPTNVIFPILPNL